jgi:hypothetical protein
MSVFPMDTSGGTLDRLLWDCAEPQCPVPPDGDLTLSAHSCRPARAGKHGKVAGAAKGARPSPGGLAGMTGPAAPVGLQPTKRSRSGQACVAACVPADVAAKAGK